MFETCRATRIDTVLAVYIGATPATLARIARNDDGCEDQSRVTFEASAGTVYSIAVDGFLADEGQFTLSWSLAVTPANDAFDSAAALSGARGSVAGETLGASAEPGEPGGDATATVWFRWTAPFTGGVTFETCGSEFDTLLAAYMGTSLGSLRELARSDDACRLQSRIRFGARAGVEYRLQLDGSEGEAGEFTLSWLASRPPSNDRFAAARPVSGVRGRVAGSNVGAFAEAGERNAVASVWFRWRAPRAMPVEFATCDRASFDTIVTVYRVTSAGQATVVETSDDACPDDRSRVVFVAVAGAEYRIAVDGYRGETGTFTLTWGRPSALATPCRVPDVVGRTLAAARRAIVRARCGVGRVAFTRSRIVPRGLVIEQFPRPGTRLPILGPVNLEVSRGG